MPGMAIAGGVMQEEIRILAHALAEFDRPTRSTRCYFCRRLLNEIEIVTCHCGGCGEWLCDACNLDSPTGRHDVEEHRASAPA